MVRYFSRQYLSFEIHFWLKVKIKMMTFIFKSVVGGHQIQNEVVIVVETKSGLNKKNVAAKFWPPFFASHLQIWTTQSSQFQGLWSMKSSASKICYFFKSIYENGFLLENPKLFFIIIIICPSLFQHRPQSIHLREK